MLWRVEFHYRFAPEFDEMDQEVQDQLLAHIQVLEKYGPRLGRPYVDTLNGSRHANMKELRVKAGGGVWRFAFAFDPERKAIMLCGGDKSDGGKSVFYPRLIDKADERFDSHLASLRASAPRSPDRKDR